MSDKTSTTITADSGGIGRGDYFTLPGEMFRITDSDGTTLTTRPVGHWEGLRRLVENYLKWPIRDLDRWLTFKVRGLIR